MLTPKVKTQIYRCKHSFTHPNLGRMLTKGKLYICESHDKAHNIIQMVAKNMRGGAACSPEKFDYYFEEANYPSSEQQENHTFFIVAVYNNDDNFVGYYSAVSQPLAKTIPRAKQYKTKAAAEYRTQRLSSKTKIIEVEATYKYAAN